MRRRRETTDADLGLKYRSAEECPQAATHTPSPDSYLGWHDWAEKMSETHEQVRCPECGYWTIWVPKETVE